jgi:prolyl 4-hydroxylase
MMITSIDRAFKIENADLDIYCIPDAISEDVCKNIIECIDAHCVPSTVTTGRRMTVRKERRSSTCRIEEWPEYKSSVKSMQNSILELTGLPFGHSEPLQGQRYQIGEYYDRHTDFFTPNTSTYQQFTESKGQRTWTAMVYLNDVVNGGATLFPTIDLAVMPSRGAMLVWNNLNSNGKENFYSMHEARPPVSNPKYVVTQWFRQNSCR